MKSRAELILEAEYYISDFEPEKVPEALFAEFSNIIKVGKRFDRYLRSQNIDIRLGKMKRSKGEMERRRLFISWYIKSNPLKPTNKCITELSRLLFVSESTISFDLYGYRKV